jgi:hypothetical protein
MSRGTAVAVAQRISFWAYAVHSPSHRVLGQALVRGLMACGHESHMHRPISFYPAGLAQNRPTATRVGPPGKTGRTEEPCPAWERGGLSTMGIVSEPWGGGKGFACTRDRDTSEDQGRPWEPPEGPWKSKGALLTRPPPWGGRGDDREVADGQRTHELSRGGAGSGPSRKVATRSVLCAVDGLVVSPIGDRIERLFQRD